MPDGPQESPYGEPLKIGPEREPLKMLPVLFVLGTIITLYLIYVLGHCLPMLQLSEPPDQVDNDMRFRGLVQTCVFNYLTALLMLCYVRCVLVHPGEVPHRDPWLYNQGSAKNKLQTQEVKKSGERRHCKWCGKYKPDRCHHCRVCRTCILKMDHHCPWIYNCVGFHNYKFFFLLLFYTMLDTQMILWTMSESMIRAVNDNASFILMFLLLFGLSLAFFLGTLVTLFFGFHVWLMLQGLTTIEFCEKRLPKKGDGHGGGGGGFCCWDNDSLYNLGVCGNIASVLGENPLLWLLPFSGPPGDGLSYEVADSYAMPRDLEVGRGSTRRKGSSTGSGGGGSSRKLLLPPPQVQQQYGSTFFDSSTRQQQRYQRGSRAH